MKRTIVTLYNTLALAAPGLKQNGFDTRNISFVVRNFREVPIEDSRADNMHKPEGMSMGALISGLSGILADVTTLSVADVGPIIAAGPLTMLLRRDRTGGLETALLRLNMSEDGAKHFVTAVRQGKTLVVLTTEANMADQAMAVLKALNPAQMVCQSGNWRYAGDTAPGERSAIPEGKTASAGDIQESASKVNDHLKSGLRR